MSEYDDKAAKYREDAAAKQSPTPTPSEMKEFADAQKDKKERDAGVGYTTRDLMGEGKVPSPLEVVKRGVRYVKDKFTKGDGKKHGGPIKKYASGGSSWRWL
jgi:hypothetical protein